MFLEAYGQKDLWHGVTLHLDDKTFTFFPFKFFLFSLNVCFNMGVQGQRAEVKGTGK